MPSLTLAQAIAAALDHHRAGRLPEAEAIYRQVLEAQPDQPDALHLLGVIAHQRGQHEQAIETIGRALAVAPRSPEFLNNLGEAYRAAGRLDEAIDSYRGAISLRADYADPHANLGVALAGRGEIGAAEESLGRALVINPRFLDAHMQLGRLWFEQKRYEESARAFESAIEVAPHDPRPYGNLGTALREMDKLVEAEQICRRGVEVAPGSADAHYNLGVMLQARQRHEQASQCFMRALTIRPDNPSALNNLGLSLQALHQMDDAVAALRRAVALAPDFAQGWCNLGGALHAAARSEEAIEPLRRAVALKPDFAEAFSNLSLVLMTRNRLREALAAAKEAIRLSPSSAHAFMALAGVQHKQGLTDDALASYRRARDLNPELRVAQQNVLLTLNYRAGIAPEDVFKEHLAWAEKFAATDPAGNAAHGNVRDPERRLRVGYLSPDFRRHSVAFFSEPLLCSHDKSQVEVFCYSDVRQTDAVTDRFRACADHWRDVANMSHKQLAELIRSHQIDVLIELAGHTTSNRLPALAHKPAPVQVSYLGYPNTAGMRQIDYRLTDAWADPEGLTDAFYTETLWRLPRCAWCYRPPDNAPTVSTRPARDVGRITFGSYNKHPKIQPPTLDAWASVLRAVPQSRLVLKSVSLGDDDTRTRLLDDFERRGVEPDRVEVLGPVGNIRDHLHAYARIDIALDPFPYNGTTTTCDALYMGVPVIALAGNAHISRVGVSLLNAVGLGELVARDADDYVRLAADLAGDADRLDALRSELRQRMASSALMDADDMARAVETALRQMWRKWCEAGEGGRTETT